MAGCVYKSTFDCKSFLVIRLFSASPSLCPITLVLLSNLAMSLDNSFYGIDDSASSNLKSTGHVNYESGIETSSNTSTSATSLEEMANQSATKSSSLLNMAFVTSATSIRPQISNVVPKKELSAEMIVVFRGHVPMMNPVPLDRKARTQCMKLHAKRLQNETGAVFMRMVINPTSIKLFHMDRPDIVLLEIDSKYLDLVKLSRKDNTFFYFSTFKAPLKDNSGETTAQLTGPSLLQMVSPKNMENFSGYDCFIFHGTSTRFASRAYRLIQQFVEENCDIEESSTKLGFFNLSTHFAGLTATESSGNENALSSISNFQQEPVNLTIDGSEPAKETFNCVAKSPGQKDLFLVDFSDSAHGSTAVSMFDTLAPSASTVGNPATISAPSNADLLGNFLLAPAIPTIPFAQQHRQYSMQMGNTMSTMNLCDQPLIKPVPSVALQVEPFGVYQALSATKAPSLYMDFKPQSPRPGFGNPFQSAQPVAPKFSPQSSMPVPMKPVSQFNSNPFAMAPSNVTPIRGSQVQSFKSQYPNPNMNPFAVPSQSNAPQTKGFGFEFDAFLKQTVKGHFKPSDKPFCPL